jgi:hypothetical protein
MCCATLHGCGNFIEHVSQGAWHEVGAPEAPVARAEGEFVVTPIFPGQGDTVRAGDLVHVRLRTGPAISDFNAWLWTGDELTGDLSLRGLLELGPARLRAALIGKRIGERFRVEVGGAPCCNGLAIPMFGFAPRDAQRELSRYDSNAWPAGALYAQRATEKPWARIEILDTCSAHLLERTADLSQWGYILNISDMHYPVSRSGRLVFGALQADCPTPRAPMRFEIGPLYGGGNLEAWDSSYASASRVSHLGIGIITVPVVFLVSFWLARRVAKNKRASPRIC